MDTPNKYKHITPSTFAIDEINLAILAGISFETINRCGEFMLDPALIAHIAKLPCLSAQYKKVTNKRQLYLSENEGYEANLITGEKVVCEYLQRDIESGEIRACILVGQKEIPLPIPSDNFFTVKTYFETNRNIASQ